MVLNDMQNPNKKVVVANTHLYFHPNANHVRMMQVAVILRHMKQLMEVYKEQVNPFLFCRTLVVLWLLLDSIKLKVISF